MQAIHAENVNWKSHERGVREAKIFSAIHGSEETRIDMVEVPSGAYIPAHRHSFRREFITILLSAGAQLQIGDRVFRPIAGQVFHREPGDVLALTNDSQHPFRYSVVRFGYESSDIEILQDSSEYDQDTFSAEDSDFDDAEEEFIDEAPTEDTMMSSSEDLEATVEMDALEVEAVAEVSQEREEDPTVSESSSTKSSKSKSSKTPKEAKSSSKSPKGTKGSKGSKGSRSKE